MLNGYKIMHERDQVQIPACTVLTKIKNCELGMGHTYAKFLFLTADFQVKFCAGRFCAKIFLSSLQSHWLSGISYANSTLSITANII